MDKIKTFVTENLLNFRSFDGLTYGIIGAVLILIGATGFAEFVASLTAGVLTFISQVLIPVGIGFLAAAAWKFCSK